MIEYRYCLVRYISDRLRMEPVNVGVILQGQGRIDFQLNTQFGRKGEIDASNFRKWRNFLAEEIRGNATPLFQPPKSAPKFLDYLAQLCDGTVTLSEPLALASVAPARFEDELDRLYRRLVAPPEVSEGESDYRPTGRFRSIQDEKDFLKRGMKRHAHVFLDDVPLWTAYRQFDNGELLAVDKVEVRNRIGYTANEIERLPRILEYLGKFLTSKINGKTTRYVFIADDLKQPFSNQAQADFDAMHEELEKGLDKIRHAGGTVLRTPKEVEELGREIDRKLPALQPSL